MTSAQLPTPPRGWKAVFWRAPIWLYRIGLGGLLAERFLLLNHTGRKSKLPRQAMLEVVKIDHTTNSYYVVSGFGEKAQWYQNIMHTQDVSIQVGKRILPARAERLSTENGKAILQEYAQKHPTAMREMSKILKLPYDGSPESISELSKMMPVIVFHAQPSEDKHV